MIDISVSYNKYKFLGYEFLTWFWFVIEKEKNLLQEIEPELASLEIGNKITFENKLNDASETLTIKGDDADLKEGILALRKGAYVTDISLIYKIQEHEWKFNIKGDSLNICNIKTPETAPIETHEDIEGAVIEKLSLYEKIIVFIENIYKKFIKIRVSNEWNETILPAVKKWIHDNNN